MEASALRRCVLQIVTGATQEVESDKKVEDEEIVKLLAVIFPHFCTMLSCGCGSIITSQRGSEPLEGCCDLDDQESTLCLTLTSLAKGLNFALGL